MSRILVAPLIFGLLTIPLTGCEEKPSEPTAYAVMYEVLGGGSGIVDITYENEGGGTSQANGASTPWTYSFTAEPGTWVYVSAQNDDSLGTVTVRIYRDQSVFKRSDCSGAYCIASAYGTL